MGTITYTRTGTEVSTQIKDMGGSELLAVLVTTLGNAFADVAISNTWTAEDELKRFISDNLKQLQSPNEDERMQEIITSGGIMDRDKGYISYDGTTGQLEVRASGGDTLLFASKILKAFMEESDGDFTYKELYDLLKDEVICHTKEEVKKRSEKGVAA